ncbi:hypothetical protein ACP4OV_001010 [Aristida adscensionis]
MGRKAKRGRRAVGRDEERVEEVSDGEAAVEEDTATGLPMANLVRLMRQVIPANVKISSNAKRLTHDCAVEFVGFVGGEASERARAQHRRTIAPEDFTWSFRELGLDDYVEPMCTYIRRYRGYHRNGGGAAGGNLAPRPPPPPPPPPAATASAVVAAPGEPSFTDEEVQFLRSVVPPPHGGYDGAESSSAHAPPAGHGGGHGYRGYM